MVNTERRTKVLLLQRHLQIVRLSSGSDDHIDMAVQSPMEQTNPGCDHPQRHTFIGGLVLVLLETRIV